MQPYGIRLGGAPRDARVSCRRTRGHRVEEGFFLIDPFNLTDAEMDYIADRIVEIAALSQEEKAATVARLAGLSAADLWARQGDWPYFSRQ